MLRKFYKIVCLYKGDLIFIFVVTACGLVLQIMCKEYLRSYEEMNSVPKVEDTKKNPENRRNPGTWLINRGGDIFKVVINLKPVIIFVAKKGGLAALVGGISVKWGPKALASKAVSTSIYKALPYSFSDDEKKRWVLIDVAKDKIIDEKWTYLFEYLSNPNIPYADKVKKGNEMLKKNIDLSTKAGRIRFFLVVMFILFGLRFLGPENNGFIAFMQSLVEALRSGKLSKRLARAIIRRLKRNNIPVDPELIDLAYSE